MSDDLLDATDVPCCQIQHRWRLITVPCSGQLRELCVSRFWNSVSADRRTRPQGHPPSQLAAGGVRYRAMRRLGSARPSKHDGSRRTLAFITRRHASQPASRLSTALRGRFVLHHRFLGWDDSHTSVRGRRTDLMHPVCTTTTGPITSRHGARRRGGSSTLKCRRTWKFEVWYTNEWLQVGPSLVDIARVF